MINKLDIKTLTIVLLLFFIRNMIFYIFNTKLIMLNYFLMFWGCDFIFLFTLMILNNRYVSWLKRSYLLILFFYLIILLTLNLYRYEELSYSFLIYFLLSGVYFLLPMAFFLQKKLYIPYLFKLFIWVMFFCIGLVVFLFLIFRIYYLTWIDVNQLSVFANWFSILSLFIFAIINLIRLMYSYNEKL